MENEPRRSLIAEGETLLQRSVNGVLSNLGWFIAVITLTVTTLLFFTDVRLEFESLLDFSVSFLLLFFAACLMYFSLSDAGASKGRQTEEYRESLATYLAAVQAAEEKAIGSALSDFCDRVREEELARQRHRILARAGITFAEYREKYDGKALPTSLPQRTKRIIRRAQRAKSPRLSPAILLSRDPHEEEQGRIPGASPAKRHTVRSALALASIAVTASFSVILVFEWLQEPGINTFLLCLCKLFTLVFNGVKGYRNGYCRMAVDTSSYNASRTRLLREFVKGE